MSQQRLLFDPERLARASDPETSKAAAAQCTSLRGQQHAEIVAILRSAGVPLNADQIAARSGAELDRVQVGRRMHELQGAGVVVVDGAAPTASGRMGQCYRLSGGGT